jgi:REP element-mobilizing transposase RayT
MPQSLSKVYVHIVYSTKYRRRIITDSVRSQLHAYIIGTASNLGVYTYALYANDNHIHILSTLPRTITIAELVSKIKTSTSKWLKSNGVKEFAWQDGYAIFSVSASNIETVSKYIINQPEHHKRIIYQDELRVFFKEYKIEYDEKYVWD